MNNLTPIISILDKYESRQLESISEELNDAWYKRQIFRTETEARFAVLNDFKFPTKAAKYWQSVREQMAHFDELIRLSFELRRKNIDLQEINIKIESESGLKKDRLNIDRDELLFNISSMQQIAKDRVREVIQWSVLKKELNDGSFDDKNVNTHQRESLFKSVLNRSQIAHDESTEEKLSINGLLYSLQKEDVNKEFIKSLQENNNGNK